MRPIRAIMARPPINPGTAGQGGGWAEDGSSGARPRVTEAMASAASTRPSPAARINAPLLPPAALRAVRAGGGGGRPMRGGRGDPGPAPCLVGHAL